MVPLRPQLQHRPAEQVVLHRRFDGDRRVGQRQHLVRGEDPQGVVAEVGDRDEAAAAEALQAAEGELAVGAEVDVVAAVVGRCWCWWCCLVLWLVFVWDVGG